MDSKKKKKRVKNEKLDMSHKTDVNGKRLTKNRWAKLNFISFITIWFSNLSDIQ